MKLDIYRVNIYILLIDILYNNNSDNNNDNN